MTGRVHQFASDTGRNGHTDFAMETACVILARVDVDVCLADWKQSDKLPGQFSSCQPCKARLLLLWDCAKTNVPILAARLCGCDFYRDSVLDI